MQLSSALAPGVIPYFPTGQSLHGADPKADLYFPGKHAVHTSDPNGPMLSGSSHSKKLNMMGLLSGNPNDSLSVRAKLRRCLEVAFVDEIRLLWNTRLAGSLPNADTGLE